MICASIQNCGAERIMALLSTVEMAEIRLDSCILSDEQIQDIFSSDVPLIATCRIAQCEAALKAGGEGSTVGGAPQADQSTFGKSALSIAEHKLMLAIKAGARFVDLEIEAPKPMSKRIAQACAEWGTVMIRSWHDFEGTPSLDELRAMVDKCRHHDGELVKIVTTAASEEDVQRVMSLYKYYTSESLVAFAMGEIGRQSRLDCLAKGAPWSYACISEAEATAPGQFSYEGMYKAVYGERKALTASQLRMPASKSYAQRAIIAAALAQGESTLEGYSPCDDAQAALAVARQLGARVRIEQSEDGSQTLRIQGIAASPQCLGRSDLNVGESGLLTRIMLPVASQLYHDGARIVGHGTLAKRPMQGAAKTMAALGAEVRNLRAEAPDATQRPMDVLGAEVNNMSTTDAPLPSHDGPTEGTQNPRVGTLVTAPQTITPKATAADILVPVEVKGPLGAGRINIDGSKSSQLVTGAIMALPLGEKHSSLSVNKPTSIPYIYMTMDILRKFGIKLRSEMYGGRALLNEDWSKCTDMLLKIKEQQRYKAADLSLEGDWSAATVFLAAGAIFGEVSLTGLDTSSLQADLSMMDILMEAGASLSQLDEPKGLITVMKAPLRAFKADLSNCPDLFPVTAVFCAFCQGQSSLRGVRRLSHKESDRASAIVSMLEQAGVHVQIKGDDMLIWGESLDSRLLGGRLLRGGDYTSHHDHRMVMALRLAELGADGPINIDDIACVAKSYPQFNKVWDEYIRK